MGDILNGDRRKGGMSANRKQEQVLLRSNAREPRLVLRKTQKPANHIAKAGVYLECFVIQPFRLSIGPRILHRAYPTRLNRGRMAAGALLAANQKTVVSNYIV